MNSPRASRPKPTSAAKDVAKPAIVDSHTPVILTTITEWRITSAGTIPSTIATYCADPAMSLRLRKGMQNLLRRCGVHIVDTSQSNLHGANFRVGVGSMGLSTGCGAQESSHEDSSP